MSELSSVGGIELDSKEYMQERADYKIALYKQLSDLHKKRYYLISFFTIALSAIVPVAVNLFQRNTLIPTIISLLLTILVGLEKLFLFREHWKNYDLAEESLRKEKYLYQTRSGAYAGKGTQEAFQLFVENFETRIHEERAETIESRTKGFDQPGM